MKRCKLCEVALVVLGWSALMSRAMQPQVDLKPDAPSTSAKAEVAKRTVASPHPMICEILYAVPKGDEGDADQNGTRSATGDEFIEIHNPHKIAIELKGYVLSDAAPLAGPESDSGKSARKSKSKGADDASPPKPKAKRSRLRFEFPALTLQPGEVAVVFNGYESRPAGPVGTQSASAAKNPNFANAYIFSMEVTSQFAALANDGDCVTLWAPDGRAIQCVSWGSAREDKKVDSAILMMEAPESKGSVTIDEKTGEFVQHASVEKDHGGRCFSPGVYPVSGPPASESAKLPPKAPATRAPKGATKPR